MTDGPVLYASDRRIGRVTINQVLEKMGLALTQVIATLFDGITRHSPEGVAFRRRAEAVGWKQAVHERDDGAWDWRLDRPVYPQG